ncbi:hypothetical protein DL96DRAFT_1817166 [Flagelloscypha sp. PMI_526]|nr:hypothetical protein DL96DRAFT_1817166 [Flagelloscypha sp. PMI_526]
MHLRLPDRFFMTYEDAVEVAIRLFHRRVVTSNPKNIILKRSTKDREGNFIWAEFEPVDWKLLVTGEQPIAVYEHVPPSDEEFIRGTLYLLLGRRISGKTHWVVPYSFQHDHLLKDMMKVDRPVSYEDAVVVVKTSGGEFRRYPNCIEAKNIGDQRLQFVEFHSTDLQSWSIFPASAYSDANVWRQAMLEPGKLFGALLLDE